MATNSSFNRIHDRCLRIVADVILISASFLLARIVAEYFHGTPPASWFPPSLFLSLAVCLVFCLPVFGFSGFYTRGRLYTGRYKLWVVVQASLLAYLAFMALSFLLPGLMVLDRLHACLAAPITATILVVARLWSILWRKVLTYERSANISSREAPLRTVLVIGGGGYVGSSLLPHLLEGGYKVRLLDLLLFGAEPIQNWLNHPNLEIRKGDFRQIDTVVEALRGMDTVIHLGGIVGDPACAIDEDLTIQVNLSATRMIAEAARGFGVQRFIFISTCSVYGASDEVLDERSRLHPVSLYARSKIASERVLQRMATASFAPVIIRFGTIFGLSGRTRFDLVVNLLTAKAVQEGRITIHGGDQWRPFIHVTDAAKAIMLALESPLDIVRNQIFNVGSDQENHTLQEVGERIQAAVPGTTVFLLPAQGDRRNYRVNFSKIKNLLGFSPEWTLDQGITQVIEAITSGKVRNYQDPIHSNERFLQEHSQNLPRLDENWFRPLIESPMEGDFLSRIAEDRQPSEGQLAPKPSAIPDRENSRAAAVFLPAPSALTVGSGNILHSGTIGSG